MPTSLVAMAQKWWARRLRSFAHPTGYELIAVIRRKAQKLPLHRVDPGDVGRDEVIAAALAGDHLKVTACVGQGGTCAAEMDQRGEILFLLRACLHIARKRKNRSHVAVQIHRCQLDGVARDRADIEAGEPAAAIRDRVAADTEPDSLGVGRIGHLVEADGAGGGLVKREGIEAQSPAPVGARDRIAGTRPAPARPAIRA